jgi:SAM-dependent methyltransferase
VHEIEQQRSHFNRIADRYHAARQEKNYLTLNRLIWGKAAAALDLVPGHEYRLLEAMCGFAESHRMLAAASQATFAVSGFDYSDTVVQALRHARPSLDIWHQDVTQFEAPPVYDLVLLIGGLHHVPSHAQDVVRRLAGALKPGGALVSFEPTNGNALIRWVRGHIYRHNALFDAETERAFEVDELLSYFRDAGLKPVQVFHPGLLSYILYYNPDAFPQLNLGGPRMVHWAFALDRLIMNHRVGRWLSFATFSIWRKPAG